MNLYEEGFTQNREISWLRYDERILDEALDETVPLFERLNYIAIFDSNLEEFMQVRVGGLIDDATHGDDDIDVRSGMTAAEQLNLIYSTLPALMYKKDKIFNQLDYKLSNAGLQRLDPQELTLTERKRLSSYFRQNVLNRLSVKLIDKRDKFPYIDQNRPYIICRLVSEKDDMYGLIDIPSEIPKIFVLEEGISEGRSMRYILMEDVIILNVNSMFSPFGVSESCCFDIARSAEVELGEDSGDQLEEMKKIVKKRKTASVDKLIINPGVSRKMLNFLADKFSLRKSQVLFTNRISMAYVSELEDYIPYRLQDELCFKPYKPFNQLSLGHGSMIDRIKSREILSAYPFDSMQPLLQLLKEAATDDRVLEIRMTIYRLASQPEIVKHLIAAAENGKKVRVLMELRARFDEAKNIDWYEHLKSHGVKVCFGDDDYKVHSKLCQLVIADTDYSGAHCIRYITQLATGNYNEKTATKYTDLSLISYDQRIGREANEIFGLLFGKSKHLFELEHLMASPINMHDGLIELIRQEAAKGEAGRIMIKCNSVTDEKLIEELMQASCRGCRIVLIVRGICCILPGVPNCTENIQVVNVVGRLLEHSRVYIFGEGSEEKMYISSADLMTRNMLKRVEIACPIYGRDNRDRIRHIMYMNCFDNVKGRIMRSDGSYARKKVKGQLIDSQRMLMQENSI